MSPRSHKLHQTEPWRKFVLSRGAWMPNENDWGTFAFYVQSPLGSGNNKTHLTVNASFHRTLFEAQKVAALVYIARCQRRYHHAEFLRGEEYRKSQR